MGTHQRLADDEEMEQRVLCRYNDKGQEILDTTPVEMPLGWDRPESLEQTIARMIHADRVRGSQDEVDSPEEGEDFMVEDDPLPPSIHEFTEFDERRAQEIVDNARAKADNKGTAEGKPDEKKESKDVQQVADGSGGAGAAGVSEAGGASAGKAGN